MDTTQALVTACGIGRKARDGGWLFRHLNLRIQGGDRIGLTGKSGSGKTLLLRSLALLDRLDEGDILWSGSEVAASETPSYRRSVVYLHQQPALIAGSVEDNLRLPFSFAVNRKHGYDPSKVAGYLRGVGLPPSFLNKTSPELSGGEQQIVCLLRCIQLEPQILLLDEPTAALDPQSAGLVEDLIASWFASDPSSRAFFWVSHDGEQIGRVAGTAFSLESGTLKATELL